MGVRDLNSVAKRYAPESITTYSSIRDFRGKTLVIDANLVTTKFHFANPYPLEGPADTALDESQGHRHARAWYDFLRRLKQNDINPIVVFDGATRLDAKARENERRRLAREVQRLRGEAEQIRGQRLRTIRALLAGVDRHGRDEFVESFRNKAREILDDRAVRSRHGQEQRGQDVAAGIGAVKDESAKLDADRKRVRELIEAFERVVQVERAGSPSSIPSPSPLPSAPSAEQVSSSSGADETAARVTGNQADPPSSPAASDAADSGIDDETAGTVAPPSSGAKEETTASQPFDLDQVGRIAQTRETVPDHLGRGDDVGPPPLELTPSDVLRDSAQPLAAPCPLSPPEAPEPAVPYGVEEQTTPPGLDDAVARVAHSVEKTLPDLGGEEPSPSQYTVPAEPPVQEPAMHPEPPPPPPPPPAPPPPTSSPVQTLASLFEAHLADATNPIYSRNQIDVFRREALFFDSLVRLAETTTTTGLADADAALVREVMMMDATEPREGQVAAGTSRPGLEGPPEQVQEQEQEPEQAGIAVGEAALTDLPPPAPASYEDDLHPLIERSSELQRSHDQRSKGISAAAFRQVRTLIEALGVPWLQPTPDHPHEAEGVCAALQQHGLADLVISEDTDVVVYGAPVLRNITLADQPRVPMNVLDPVKLREALGMSKAEFVDLAILLGTDFTERIKGLGPVSALKAVRKYRSIENVLVAMSDRFSLDETFTAAYLATAQTARDIFLNLPPLPRMDPLPTTSGRPFAEDGTDLGAAASGAISEPATYFGSLQPAEPSPILPLLLAKYGITRASPSLEYESFLEDAFVDADDIGSTLVEEDDDDVEFDWGDLDELEVNLVADIGTVEDVENMSDFAEDSTPPDPDALATTSTSPHAFPSLDTTFERLYL